MKRVRVQAPNQRHGDGGRSVEIALPVPQPTCPMAAVGYCRSRRQADGSRRQIAALQTSRLLPLNVRAEPPAEAGVDWPPKDNDNDGLARSVGACRTGSARGLGAAVGVESQGTVREPTSSPT